MRSAAERRANPWQLPERIAGYFNEPWRGPTPPEEIARWNGSGATRTLVLHGPYGTGKTRLAARLFMRHCQLGAPFHYRTKPYPLWWNASDLVQAARDEFDDQVRSVVRQAQATSWLVLDDFGGERSTLTDFEAETLALVLNSRWEHLRATVFTTNWTLSDWQEFSPRIASRLFGNEGAYFELSGQDMRQSRQETA